MIDKLRELSNTTDEAIQVGADQLTPAASEVVSRIRRGDLPLDVDGFVTITPDEPSYWFWRLRVMPCQCDNCLASFIKVYDARDVKPPKRSVRFTVERLEYFLAAESGTATLAEPTWTPPTISSSAVSAFFKR